MHGLETIQRINNAAAAAAARRAARNKTTLPDIHVTGPQLSDLFFNTEHPYYDAVDRNERPGITVSEELAAAIRKDAEEFSDLIGNQVDPELLAKDFSRRL